MGCSFQNFKSTRSWTDTDLTEVTDHFLQTDWSSFVWEHIIEVQLGLAAHQRFHLQGRSLWSIPNYCWYQLFFHVYWQIQPWLWFMNPMNLMKKQLGVTARKSFGLHWWIENIHSTFHQLSHRNRSCRMEVSLICFSSVRSDLEESWSCATTCAISQISILYVSNWEWFIETTRTHL